MLVGMKEKLLEAHKRLEARMARFDDRKIADGWVALAADEPTTIITTKRGLRLLVARRIVHGNRVQYEAYIVQGLLRLLLRKPPRVAWMYCQAPMAGRVQVTNANVYDIRGKDFRLQGIGTAMYDLIEKDVKAAGAEGIEPHWGSLSEDAIEFWKKRRPDHADKIVELNGMYPPTASGLFD